MNFRKARWLVGVILIVSLLVGSIVMINSFYQENKKSGGSSSTPTQTSPQDPNSPATPTDPAAGESGGGDIGSVSRKDNSKDAVNAAAQATQALSVAQLLPENLLEESVNTLVVPESRKMFIGLLKSAGPSTATVWGYTSVDDALANSEYVVRTSKYRVDNFDANAGNAVVSLYTMTHFVTRKATLDNQFKWKAWDSPRIIVVQMRWQKERWLYVRKSDPKKGQAPSFSNDDVGLTFAQVEGRYKPFLEKGGFKNYG